MTKKELTELARKRGVKGYTTMTKAELESALGMESATETTVEKAEAPAQATRQPVKPGKAEKPTVPATSASASATLEAKVPAQQPATSPSEPPVSEAAEATPEPVAGLVPAEALADQPPEKDAAPADKTPGAPRPIPLKKTWTNEALLIDDEIEPLPAPHPRDRAVLLVRDPFWVYAYWELSPESIRKARSQGGVRMALRVHDVSDLVFDGRNSHLHFDLPMPSDDQRVWYLNVPTDGRSYLVEVGFHQADGTFMPIVRSNHGTTPRARLSEVISDRFVALDFQQPLEEVAPPTPVPLPAAPTPALRPAMTEPAAAPAELAAAAPAPELPVPTPVPDAPRGVDISEQMYRLSLRGGGASSVDVPHRFAEWRHLMRATSSEGLIPGIPSSAEFAKPEPPGLGKDFWLIADCELIVYGATEPDARLTVRGQAVELRPDGTFTMRFALPDGLHPIPIRATNADGDMHRAITITVSRGTTVGS